MALTDTQKAQIRFMVSQNPTIDNMERIAGLTDKAVLEEVETFKSTICPRLEQEKAMLEQQAANTQIILANTNTLIELMAQ